MIFLLSVVLLAELAAGQQQERMTFFLTSVGKGDGANLGGLAGADAHCGQLAADAGANSTGLIWRAYLSANSGGRLGNVNARDRIGAGPWFNFRGVRVATDVSNLHTLNGTLNMLGKNTSLTERGATINGRGETPLQHDILTGSTADGNLIGNATCNDWTSNAGTGVVARLGHHDKDGGGEAPTSWNSAHNSRGCSQTALTGTGGAGLFYCFAQPGTSPATFTARPTIGTTTTTTNNRRTTTTTVAPTTSPTRFTLRTTTAANANVTTSTGRASLGTTSVGGATSTGRGSLGATTTTTTSSPSSTASGSGAAPASGASDAPTTSGATFGGNPSGSAAASGSATLPEAGNNSAAGSDSAAQVDSSASTAAVACSAVLAAAMAVRL